MGRGLFGADAAAEGTFLPIDRSLANLYKPSL
jgi:hypothetical protein